MVSTARVIPPVLEPLRRYSQRALQPVIRIGHMFAFFVRAVMGVPVVALAGNRHASRVSMSILHTIGAPELVAASAREYVSLASSLASDTSRLRHYRSSLRDQLVRSPACDAAGFATRFAAALHKAWEERATSGK